METVSWISSCVYMLKHTRISQNVTLLEISSIHDGHDQTKLVLCLESVRQWHNEATVNLLENPLLHHRPLRRKIKTVWNAWGTLLTTKPTKFPVKMCFLCVSLCVIQKRRTLKQWPLAKSRARYNCTKEFHSEELLDKAPSNHSIPVLVFNTAG